MRRELIIIAAVLIIFLILASADPLVPGEIGNSNLSNYSNLLFSYQIMRYSTDVQIVPYSDNINVGVVSDPWNLRFGIIPGNGSYEKRYINISSLGATSRITMKTYGNISDLVSFSSNNFILNPGKSISIEVLLNTSSATFGVYTGEIDVISKTPLNSMFGSLT